MEKEMACLLQLAKPQNEKVLHCIKSQVQFYFCSMPIAILVLKNNHHCLQL